MSRWRCRLYCTRLVDYSEGRLSSAEKQPVERHLARCPECTEDLLVLREVPATLRMLAAPDPGEAFWLHQRQEIARAIRQLSEQDSPAQARWCLAGAFSWPWRAAFAAAAIAVTLTLYHFARVPLASRTRSDSTAPAALDNGALVMLHEYTQTLAPDGGELGLDHPDQEAWLAALPFGDLVSSSSLPGAPEPAELEESEWKTIGVLVGGLA